MLIVIKEQDKIVVGFANSEWAFPYTDADAMQLDNVPVKHLAGKKDRIVAFSVAGFLPDLIRYDDEVLENPTTAEEMKREIVPMLKNMAEHFKRVNEDGDWQNSMVVVEGDKIFDVNITFAVREIVNYVCHGYNVELVESVLDATEGLPARERIIKAVTYHARMVGISIPVIAIFDTTSLDCEFVKGE